MEYRSVPGGMLAQQQDLRHDEIENWQHAAGPAPTTELINNAVIIWTVCKHLKSNAIAIGGNSQLYGAGAGQMDRVASAKLALEKAGDKSKGAVAASDAFFPFPDAPQLLIEAGVKMIVQPGGSKRDHETLTLCNDRGVTCMLTGIRHFRH